MPIHKPFHSGSFALSLLASLCLAPAVHAQSSAPTPAPSTVTPPDAPVQQIMTPAQVASPQSLTLRQRFTLQTKVSFSLSAFAAPAFESAITMANPPDGYPRDWSDGGGAFGRNYGADFGRDVTAGFTQATAAAILREDPRYYPSTQTNVARRIVHALAFTIVDRSNSGHATFAASNFVGSAAGGFVGMAWEPDGFDDTTHALQRSALEVTSFAGHNLLLEFDPEITHLLVKLHLGRLHEGARAPIQRSPAS